MKTKKYILILVNILLLVFLLLPNIAETKTKSPPADMSTDPDYKFASCYTVLDKKVTTKIYKDWEKNGLIQIPACVENDKEVIEDKKKAVKCSQFLTIEACNKDVEAWKATAAAKSSGTTSAGSSASNINTGPGSISGWIKTCGQQEDKGTGCRDITVFVSLALDAVNYLFGIIGALALGVFVYGGFQLIISQGNPEKVKVGTGAMLNAIIGLVIAFSGYVLVSFLATAIGVKEGFTLLK